MSALPPDSGVRIAASESEIISLQQDIEAKQDRLVKMLEGLKQATFLNEQKLDEITTGISAGPPRNTEMKMSILEYKSISAYCKFIGDNKAGFKSWMYGLKNVLFPVCNSSSLGFWMDVAWTLEQQVGVPKTVC